MTKHLKIIAFILAVASSLVVYQNCGDSKHVTSEASISSKSFTQEALTLRQTRCAGCHQEPNAQAEPRRILDDDFLIANHWVKPGDPQNSPLYSSLSANMPLNGTPFTAEEKKVIANWIIELANGPRAELVIEGEALFDFGTVITGSTAEHVLTIKNTGFATAMQISEIGLQAPFAFKGGAFPGQGGTCLQALPENFACTLVITYAPSNTGTHNDTLELSYDDGTSIIRFARVDVRGQSSGPAVATLTISNSLSFNFPLTAVGASAEASFTVRNSGSAAATDLQSQALSAPFSFKDGAFPGTGGTCGATLAASASCTLIVRYTPTAAGSHSTTLTLNYHDGAAARPLALTLSGVASSGSSVTYSQVRTILSNSCLQCHSSEWGSTYQDLLAFKKAPNSGPAITPRSSTSRFITRISSGTNSAPQMGTGIYGSLNSTDRQKIIDWIMAGAPDDQPSDFASLNLSDGPSYGFGQLNVGTSLERSFTLTNTGARSATSISGSGLSTPFTFVGGAYPGTGGTCGATLAAAASCTIKVRYAPSTTGTFSDSIEISYHDGVATKATTRPLTGSAIGAAIASLSFVAPSPQSFGIVAGGASADKTLQIKNNGTAPASGISANLLAMPFRYKGGVYPGTGGTCSTSLAAAATCQIVVQFAPSASGDFSAALNLNYNNSSSQQSTSLTLSGTGSAAAVPVYYSEVRTILTNSCVQCHSSEWGSTYQGLLAFKKALNSGPAITPRSSTSRFITRISSETNSAPQMGKGIYGSLNSTDRQKIIDWIMAGAPDDPAGTVTQVFRPIIGDRYYVSSVLLKVFGDSGGVQGAVAPIINRADIFGSTCHLQDTIWTKNTNGTDVRKKLHPLSSNVNDNCLGGSSNEARLGAETVPESSSIRESIRITACMKLSNSLVNIETALTRAGLSPSAEFTPTNITTAYQQFYPGVSPSADVISKLSAIGADALDNPNIKTEANKTKRHEGWRFIYLSLCMSSGWQAP